MPRERGTDGQRDHTQPGDVDPEGGRQVLVLLERTEQPAQAAVDDLVEHGEPDDEETGAEVVKHQVLIDGREVGDQGQPADAQSSGQGQVQNPLGPIGDRRKALGRQARRFRQAQGDHREIDALEAQQTRLCSTRTAR